MQRCALPHRSPTALARARRRATAHSPLRLTALGGLFPAALLSMKESKWPHLVGEESTMRASAIRTPRVLSDAGASGSKAAVADQSGKRTTMAFYKHGSLGNVAEGVNLIQSEIYLDRGRRGPLLNGLSSVLL